MRGGRWRCEHAAPLKLGELRLEEDREEADDRRDDADGDRPRLDRAVAARHELPRGAARRDAGLLGAAQRDGALDPHDRRRRRERRDDALAWLSSSPRDGLLVERGELRRVRVAERGGGGDAEPRREVAVADVGERRVERQREPADEPPEQQEARGGHRRDVQRVDAGALVREADEHEDAQSGAHRTDRHRVANYAEAAAVERGDVGAHHRRGDELKDRREEEDEERRSVRDGLGERRLERLGEVRGGEV